LSDRAGPTAPLSIESLVSGVSARETPARRGLWTNAWVRRRPVFRVRRPTERFFDLPGDRFDNGDCDAVPELLVQVRVREGQQK
jgi:hypothetical protein